MAAVLLADGTISSVTGDRGGIEGRLEATIAGRAVGWAWDPADPSDRLRVEIIVDGATVAEGSADLDRRDLQQADIGDGAHGFAIDLPAVLDDGDDHAICARVTGAPEALLPSGHFVATAIGTAWASTSFTAHGPAAVAEAFATELRVAEATGLPEASLLPEAVAFPGGDVTRAAGDGGAAPPERIMIVFGQRISRDAGVYLVALAVGLPLSLVSVAVTTRYLSTAQFGRLSVLFLAAGFLTVAYNMISLQGTFMWAVGGSGEADGSDATDDLDRPMASNRRRAMGSGIVLSVIVTSLGTGAVILLSGSVSAALLGSDRFSAAVCWAALSAGFGALWRFSVNVLREERHPYQFAVTSAARPILALAVSIPLLEAGYGFDGVMAATAIGTLLSGSLAMWIGRHAYTLALDASDVRQIFKLGKTLVPLIFGIWLIHNVDLLALSRYASPSTLGIYRVASRLGQFPSYVVSAFLMAISPLARTSLLRAAQDRLGQQRVTAAMFTYFVLVNLTVLVAVGIGANVLVHVAGASYRDAAPVIPLVGLGFVLYGIFYFLARFARIAHKTRWFASTALASSGVVGLTAAILIPRLGAYGAALSLVVGMAWATAIFLFLIARSPEPIPFQWGKLGLAAGLAAVTFTAGAYNGLSGRAHTAVGTAMIVLYPLALVVSGIVPRGNVQPLLEVLRSAFPRRPPPDFVARLKDLRPSERVLLERIVRRGEAYQTVAADLTLSSSLALGRTVRALRLLEGVPNATADDARIGRVLLGREPHLETDRLIQQMWTEGVDPLDLHHVETAVATVRRVPRRAWSNAGRPPRRFGFPRDA